jgi:hypothetical protein
LSSLFLLLVEVFSFYSLVNFAQVSLVGRIGAHFNSSLECRSLQVEFSLWEKKNRDIHVVWSLHCHRFIMDYKELKEIRRVLRNHEESI